MFEDLKILQMASALARHASARHELIAENIANADTPGYHARDLEDFSSALKRASQGDTESSGSDRSTKNGFRMIDSTAPGTETPNGNSVSLEDQMVRAVDAQSAHDAATAIYKKTMDILRTSLGRGA
ncbi:MAG: FlgB family protein [Parvularculaceae bacterium]|nr:FlgB family protein [Parvularculaceae bacterium]